MFNDDPPGIVAKRVALNPLVNTYDNVQDALDNLPAGGVTLGNFTTDAVNADAATSLTGDGAAHPVSCVIAAPPAWMDNAGNIIVAGLYNVFPQVRATASPTTPGQFITVSGAFSANYHVACDGLGAAGVDVTDDVQAIAAGDLPYSTSCLITMPTDVTEAVDVLVNVVRLAF